MDLKDQLRNLALMSAADGSFTQEEIRFLSDRAAAWGIPNHEFLRAFDEALSDEYSLAVPTDRGEQIELLENLVRMMGSDGHIAEVERKLLDAAAAATSTTMADLNQIIDRVLEGRPEREPH
jgi:hypothetical protein